MLTLSKYEFRKSRNFIITLAVLFFLLESYFLYSIYIQDSEKSAESAIFLMLYASVCYFAIFILAIANYSKELNSKSSYLIFMTPTTSLSIIFSKIFTILIIGIIFMTVICGVGYFDWLLLFDAYPDLDFAMDSIQSVMIMMGINSHNFVLGILLFVIAFIISFFSSVTIAYLAITLSATLLQNNRFRGIVSFAFFMGITYVFGIIGAMMPVLIPEPVNIWEVFISIIPSIFLNLIMICISVFGSAYLLDKKLSL